jgi:hypothetical protein
VVVVGLVQGFVIEFEDRVGVCGRFVEIWGQRVNLLGVFQVVRVVYLSVDQFVGCSTIVRIGVVMREVRKAVWPFLCETWLIRGNGSKVHVLLVVTAEYSRTQVTEASQHTKRSILKRRCGGNSTRNNVEDKQE